MGTDREQTMCEIEALYVGVSRAWQRATSPHWIELDLTMAQLKALFTVARDEPITVGMLGQTLGIHLPAASHTVDRLFQLGLVERGEDPGDRRRTLVRLTGNGKVLVEQLRQGKRDRLRSSLAEIGEEDLLALLRGLRALVAAAEARSG
jgi:MarR family transcriptional regulator, organic hydroperoxide resistance regulator